MQTTVESASSANGVLAGYTSFSSTDTEHPLMLSVENCFREFVGMSVLLFSLTTQDAPIGVPCTLSDWPESPKNHHNHQNLSFAPCVCVFWQVCAPNVPTGQQNKQTTNTGQLPPNLASAPCVLEKGGHFGLMRNTKACSDEHTSQSFFVQGQMSTVPAPGPRVICI